MARVENPASTAADAQAEAKSETATPAKPKRVANSRSRSTKAKDAPAIIRKHTETDELPKASEGVVKFDNEGEKQVEGVDFELEHNVHNFTEKADKLKFLEEKVTIILAEGQEKNAETHVFLAVNGVGPGPDGLPWVPRNKEITIARKYLEVLARARGVRYKSVEATNNDGERTIENRASSSQRYPFTVLHDPNPRGRDWLRNLMASERAG